MVKCGAFKERFNLRHDGAEGLGALGGERFQTLGPDVRSRHHRAAARAVRYIARSLTADGSLPGWGLRQDGRDDFIDRSLGFKIIGDRFGNGKLTGPMCWNTLGHQLAGIDQQPRADSFLQAMIA